MVGQDPFLLKDPGEAGVIVADLKVDEVDCLSLGHLCERGDKCVWANS